MSKYSVQVHSSTALTNEDADTMFVGAVELLKTVDGSGDVSCEILWSRDGDVGTFNEGSGSIDSSNDYSVVKAVPSNIKVVRYINWCGGPATAWGCSDYPGTSMVVAQVPDPLLAVVVWAHEYGHNKGINDRPQDDAFALMAPHADKQNRQVNPAEAAAFEASFFDKIATPRCAIPTSDHVCDVRTLVKRHYIHGFPVDTCHRYNMSATPTLLEMLTDPAQQQYSSNVVSMLCMLGDDRAVDPLIKWFEGGDGRLSYYHFAGKRAFLLHFGILVNRTGNRGGLDFLVSLIKAASRGNWPTRWSGPFGEHGDALNRLLLSAGLWSLGFAAMREARTMLRDVYTASKGEASMQGRAIEAAVFLDQIEHGGVWAFLQRLRGVGCCG